MGKVVPLNAQQQGTALTVAEAIETFLDREWTEHTRRNFASDLKKSASAHSRNPSYP